MDLHSTSDKTRALNFDQMTERTREVLLDRLNCPRVTEPRYFSQTEFARLQELCAYALPQDDVDIAGNLDTRFAEHAPGKGWRYDDLPPAPEMYREILKRLESATIEEMRSSAKPPWIEHFWEDFLADVTETYFSHPRVQASIGARGAMDVKP